MQSPLAGAGSSAPFNTEQNAGRALAVGTAALVLLYAWLFFVSGERFLVIKTAVMPIFVLYATMLPQRTAFLTAWLPFLAGTVLFDALRGAIYLFVLRHHLPVYASYTIAMERLLFRIPAAPLFFQQWRTRWLDVAAVAVHASHFAFFLLFGLVLWHRRPEYFGRYRRALLIVMALGLIGYLCVPSVPPWMAYEDRHLLPPIAHVATEIYTTSFTELYGSFDTNPIAAMPSLHVAFPVACTLIGFLAYGRRVGLALSAYAGAVILGVMYLGEHYAVDVLAGVLVAAVAVRLAARPWRASLSLAQSLVASGVIVALTVAILLRFR